MSMQRVRGIPLSALSPKFLHTNSTSHTWPFSAIAELIDNAYDPDVMARQFWIDWTRIKGFDCLTFQDNGNGLTRSRMYKMLSFGFSEKQIVKGHIPVGVYGNGFKSGSMRLGKDAIVFSKTRDSMSVGLLSQTYLKSIQAKHVVVPIITFRRVGQNLDEDAASLQAILKHSLFNTVEELFSELRAISCISSTGTRVIIWNLRRVTNGETEFDFSTDRYDIQILANACEKYKHQDHVAQLVPEIDYSLRAYCSILYLKPRMQIIIRGQKVKTQLISQSLAHRATDYYRPSFLNKRVRVIFGYNTNSKEQYGIMMYHKNRLIKAYVRVGCQRKGDFRGVGVIGVIECNFLQPTHNKQDFDNTDEYRKTVNNLGVKLEEYWNEIRFRCKNENPRCTIPIEDTIKCPDQTWVQCDECLKWRKIPDGIDCKRLPDKWFCHMNPDPQYRSCRTEEEPEDSEDEQHSYPKPYKRRKKNSKMKGEENKQQVPAPALLLTAMPLSESEAWRPLEGAVIWPSCTGQGHSLANDTMLMDNESHQSTTVERVKQMSPHAVGVSLMEMDNPAMATPSLPPLIPASTQMNIKPAPSTECWGKEVENQGEPSLEEACENEMAAKALERNGPRKVMMLLKHQQEVVWEPMQTSTQERDAYREQVHQLQKELEEVKHRCEYLQVVEREHDNLQRRLEDMEVKNTELTCQCEQLKKELKQLRRKKHTGTPSTEEGTQNNVNISSPEEDGRKLRNLRQCVGRLLVTFVPALDLDQVNLNSEVIDEILEQVLNEVT